MAEVIARKLGDIQAWLTDHGARLDALTSAIEDHTTRIITLEETVAGLIIPRRLPFSRSSTCEYKIYAEPIVGTSLTVQVKAETDKEAIKKAEKMFNTQLVKVEILSKHASKTSSPKPSRWVLEMYPIDVLAWRRSLVELAGKPLTATEYRLVSSYDNYLRRKGYLTSRQIEVLGEIARRHDVELPAIPEVVR